MTNARRRSSGFTLAELMVAFVIMAVVITQMMVVFTTQHKTYVGQAKVMEIQQEARLLTELMLSDVRMAGFMVSDMVGAAGRDGGTTAPDVLCTSDPSTFDDAMLLAATASYVRASLGALLDQGDSFVDLAAGHLDIDEDGNNDFVVNGGIIVSDGTDSHCARITAINAGANRITFTPATPGGFSADAPTARAVPAIIYELAGTEVRRNNVPFSSHVENLQFEFAIDTNGNGAIDGGEFPIHDMTASNPALIRGLRISVIARVPSENPDFRSLGMPPAGNHDAGAPDGFVRRRFTANAVPRNML